MNVKISNQMSNLNLSLTLVDVKLEGLDRVLPLAVHLTFLFGGQVK